jgi:hypothetical protein
MNTGSRLVDTLHLTQCLRPGVLAWDGVKTIDERLAAIEPIIKRMKHFHPHAPVPPVCSPDA